MLLSLYKISTCTDADLIVEQVRWVGERWTESDVSSWTLSHETRALHSHVTSTLQPANWVKYLLLLEAFVEQGFAKTGQDKQSTSWCLSWRSCPPPPRPYLTEYCCHILKSKQLFLSTEITIFLNFCWRYVHICCHGMQSFGTYSPMFSLSL